LENLGVTDFLLLLSLDMLGAWLKAILKVVGPEDIIPIEYEAYYRCEHAWSERRQTRALGSSLACQPHVSLHAERAAAEAPLPQYFAINDESSSNDEDFVLAPEPVF
jgi:hypothetical protein